VKLPHSTYWLSFYLFVVGFSIANQTDYGLALSLADSRNFFLPEARHGIVVVYENETHCQGADDEVGQRWIWSESVNSFFQQPCHFDDAEAERQI